MKIAISFLIDSHPKYVMQGWNLLLSLKAADMFPHEMTSLFVHHPKGMDSGLLRVFAASGAKLVPFIPFGDGPNAVYCNKLRQLESDEIVGSDYAILLDADILALHGFLDLCEGEAVKAKVVDYPNPPESIWIDVLTETGLANKTAFVPTQFNSEPTPHFNCNGGLYVLPKKAMALLRDSWPRWARFCLARGESLGKFAHHADQMSFALAMIESGLPFHELPIADNFPSHFAPDKYKVINPSDISVLHYHGKMDNHGLPIPIGVGWIDRQIQEARSTLANARRTDFDNRIFWDYRYACHPELGSGVGSRGDTLSYKRNLLAPYMRIFKQDAVVDVGCGDLETTRFMPSLNYLGIDSSRESLATARTKRPDWRFESQAVDALSDKSAALVLCLDVLIHQQDKSQYEKLVANLIRVASTAVIVSGYEEAPVHRGIVYFHEPLSLTLQRLPEVASVEPLGVYGGVTLNLVILKQEKISNRSDIPIQSLVWGVRNCSTPDLLVDLVKLSREKLAFFPQTIIRTLEYPWVAARLSDCAGQQVLDVGAGICALPLWLAQHGLHVTTVDSHPRVRTVNQKLEWNEWGFLDYAEIDPRITSHNKEVQVLNLERHYDVIYSVSVIEHMPAVARRDALATMARAMKIGGRLLLTLDLVPQSNDLWLLSEGKLVDPDLPHGTLEDLSIELSEAGFEVFEQTSIRNIPTSRTDIVLIDARLKSSDRTEI